ncbi:argininosuccinate lyase [Salipiger sp. P9]|nr:argininosuccinate lyase [Salipiger pentaromativorans]MCR8548797.1 argininosuccinate lyase [Salipiger pentaromativorans]
MRPFLLLTVVALLAGCGADGDPVRPEPAAETGFSVSVTGTAEVGIAKR